jgi:uncharacterized membrane protein
MPLWLLAEAQEVTRVRWEDLPPTWQVFLIVVLVLAFAAATYLLEPRGERRALKVPLAVLRGLAIIVAIGILFRPIQSRELQDVKNGQVVLAIDTSRSMAFLDREKDDALRAKLAEKLHISEDRLRELDRLSRVKLALRQDGGAWLRELAKKNRVRVFTFDSTRERLVDVDKLKDDDAAAAAPGKDDKGDGKEGDAAPGTKPDPIADALARIEGCAADGASTALGDSLERMLTDLRSERVAGLVLITDGRQNAGSLSAEAVASRFGRKGIKIYAVGVGDPEAPRDLSVDDFRAPDVTLAGDVLAGAVNVKAQGYAEPHKAHVRILLDQQQVAEETVQVGGAKPETEVAFSTKVTQPGEYTLEAVVDPDPDELTADNNRAIRRIRVIDERIKVLYIEGYPRWEYRYLKNALVRDRHMQVQVLLLSADPEFHQEHSDTAPPLTRLPSPEQLLEYHVIILGDVNPEARTRTGEPVFGPGSLEAIREMVKERGGGLLMISGEQSAPRAYVGTPLEDVLPIVIDPTAGRTQDFSRPWRPKLTKEGDESPLLRLEPDLAENHRLWDVALPDLFWYVPVERTKPLAQVLAVHPRDRNSNGAFPLIVWQRFGAGTSFWLGFDEAWRWRAGVGDKYHYRFYGQIIRFLSLQSFTRTKRFFVTTDKTQYAVGEDVRVTAEIRDRDAGLVDKPTQDVLVDQPDGKTQTLTLKAVGADTPGKFEGTYKPVLVGPYRVHIDPGQNGSMSEVASRIFEVKLPRLELQEPRMDKDGLERIAQASGGEFLRLSDLDQVQIDEVPPESIPIGRKETELWDRPWVFALFFGLLLVEWIGRKISRLL